MKKVVTKLYNVVQKLYFRVVKDERKIVMSSLMDVYKDVFSLQILTCALEVSTNKFKILTKRPGLIIGKGGEDINKLEKLLSKRFGKNLTIEIIEYKYNSAWQNI